MSWRDTLRTATDAVRTHRLRSALTMLGILIGITAVILTVGLGRGARNEVRDQINELGTNILVVSPGSSTNSSGVRGGFGSSSTLTMQDADALGSNAAAPDIQAVAATASTPGSLTYGDTNWTTTLTGTTPSWQQVRSREVTSGRFITAADENGAASVIVLGPDTATELFGGRDPVGQNVSYNGTQLEVIGVLQSLSSSDNTSNNDLAIVRSRRTASGSSVEANATRSTRST
jgi:putative ABC transport system permease protein